MKLSKLKLLVAEMDALSSPENPDPGVTVYIMRPEGLPVLPRESGHFVECEIDVNPGEMRLYRIVKTHADILAAAGDFSLLAKRVPVYK